MEKIYQQLHERQIEQLNKLKKKYIASEKLWDNCVNYYLEYCKKSQPIHESKLEITLKCAFFLSQKSEITMNMNGERMKSISESLQDMLKNNKLDEIVVCMKDFYKKITINSIEKEFIMGDVNYIIKEISFLSTIYSKFQQIIERLELKERNNPESGEYTKQFTLFCWLIFIESRQAVVSCHTDPIDHVSLLAHVFAFLLSYGWDYMLPMGMFKWEKERERQRQRKLKQNSPFQEVAVYIKEIMMDMLIIKANNPVNSVIAKAFEHHFQTELIQKAIIKNSRGKTDFLANQLINANCQRLDKLYRDSLLNSLSSDKIDQRIFFRDRAQNLTPSKLTPFARQGYANKNITKIKLGGNFGNFNNSNETVVNPQQYASHRMLNYDNFDKIQNVQKITPTNLAVMKLPKAVMQSPSMMKVPLICSTPITTNMVMFNYVNEKAKKFQNKEMIARKYDEFIISLIGKIYQGKKEYVNIIFALYKSHLEDYLQLHPSEKNSQDLYKAMMVIAIEIMLFVTNGAISFEHVQQQAEVDAFSVWKACDFYLKSDKTNMPTTLRTHLLDIDTLIVSSKIWSEESTMSLIHNFCKNERDKDQVRYEATERMFRRILHQIGVIINQVCLSGLQLEDNICQQIYQTMKFILSQSIKVLGHRHLDQIIMCATFGVCKRENITVKFSQIVDSYCDLIINNKQQHEAIIYKIQVQDNNSPHQTPTINLVNLYNFYFIKDQRTHQFIRDLKNNTHNSSTHQVSENNTRRNYNTNANLLLQSPLKEVIPNQINKMKSRKSNNLKNNNVSTRNNTNHLLYAYNESPMLKHQAVFKAPINSKKVINFEKEEKQYNSNKTDNENYSERISNKEIPSDFNSKKFVTNNIANQILKPSQKQTSQHMGVAPNRNKNLSQHTNPYELNQFSTNPPQSNYVHHNHNAIQLGKGVTNIHPLKIGSNALSKGISKHS